MVIAPVIASLITTVVLSRPIVKFIAVNRFLAANCEHCHVYGCALAIQKFALLILLISRSNSQRFVARYRRISTHGLVVYPHLPIHSAALAPIRTAVVVLPDSRSGTISITSPNRCECIANRAPKVDVCQGSCGTPLTQLLSTNSSK